MPLRLKALTQLNPGSCTHYNATMVLDGQTESVEVSVRELGELFRTFPGGYKRALVLGLMHYRLEKGFTVANLVGNVRIGDGD